MPTVNVDKEDLFKILGEQYSTDEFRELCFEFGIELEEDTSASEATLDAEGKVVKPTLKIDISANRHDLLCAERIAQALLIFQGKCTTPKYRLADPPKGQEIQKLIIKPETARIRPYVVAAILRDVTFTQEAYDSFIDLQDKLHNNICRKRTVVSMGTHDLDTIQGPFTYDARAPEDIRFIPLNQTQEMDGHQLMKHYDENDKHIRRYLHIIRDSPVYPVILDGKDRVCSLPPIINGDHSKISVNTRNIFIEITATDLGKASTVLNMLVTAFSTYCANKYTVEPVDVVQPDGRVERYPKIATRTMRVKVDYMNSAIGISQTPAQYVSLLSRMSLQAKPIGDGQELEVEIGPERSDILHPCDIMEDAAVAYGYNRIPRTFPRSSTIGNPMPIQKLSDQVRRELALSGFSEVLPLILCSHDENFAYLNRKDDGTTAIKLANPKTMEYQVVRTSLLPGILKTLHSNRKHPLPIQIFEVSDIALKDDREERQARNERRVAALYSGKASGFEVIHGLLHRIMSMIHTPLIQAQDTSSEGYYILESEDPTYFPGRSATIHLRSASGSSQKIGSFGILHPTVLDHFSLDYPCSVFEFNLEPFL
ncbi:MAG: beta subunit of phenylalanyl-tRNA synthetase [Piptocephalis tieghemiana]|nr:MAG: beta subunit of phenylalanyl-tRNA synthetase [Piptocephalis tieghemiana]